MKKSFLGTICLLALVLVFTTSCKDEKKTTDTDVMEEVVVDEIIIEEVVEIDEPVSTESATEASEEASVTKDVEEVTVSYSYTVLGKEIKGSKTFDGTQAEVESAVKALTDSIQKIDPAVKITTD